MQPQLGLRIALFGPPGAGKGTQARLLCTRFGMLHISTGNILRRAIKEQTPIGLEARAYIHQGNLVPDELVRDLAEEAMRVSAFEDFVLDGYPRTCQQAEWLTGFLNRRERPLSAIVYLMLSDEEVVTRLSRRRVHKETGENFHLDYKPPPPEIQHLMLQRRDDQPAAIRHRLRVYEAETQPLVRYFSKAGLLHEVDALGSIETVHARVCALLQSLKGRLN